MSEENFGQKVAIPLPSRATLGVQKVKNFLTS